MRIVANVVLGSTLQLAVIASLSGGTPHLQNNSNRNSLRLVVQLGHGREGVNSVAFSTDGALVITGSCDGTAVLWDATTGEELRRFVGHGECVNAVAVSPNNRFVLTGAGVSSESQDNSARLWDISTGLELSRFDGHTDGIASVAFSPDGQQVLTGGWDRTARLWNVANGRQLKSFTAGKNSHVTAVAFAPDGRHVALGQTLGTASLWDITTGAKVLNFETNLVSVSDVEALAFSPDGQLLVTGGDVDLAARIFDVRTGKEQRKLIGHTGIIKAIAFSGDGKFVLTGSGGYGETQDNSVRLWDAASGSELRRFTSHTDEVTSVAFSPDGRYALTSSGENSAKLWNLTDGKEVVRFESLAPTVECIALSPDGRRLIAGGSDNAARMWESTSGKVEEIFRSSAKGEITSLVFSPDGRHVLIGSTDGSALLWDVETATEQKRFRGPPLKDAGTDTGKVLSVNAVDFSPDGQLVATGSGDETVRVWNVATGKMVWQLGEVFKLKRDEPLPPPANVVTAIAFSPDGSQLASSYAFDNRTHIWNLRSGKASKFLSDSDLGDGFINDIEFSQDGRWIATATSKTTKIWDAQTGKQIHNFPGEVYALTFSPDSRHFLTSRADGFATLKSVENGREVKRFATGDSAVSVAFTGDGRFLVTGSTDGSTRYFDVAGERELCRLISLKDDSWVVIDAEGRFDTNNLEAVRGLHWMVPDSPFKALPIEVFMRDYYEPRLLPRLLKCSQENNCEEEFKPVRDLTSLNRTQPDVFITNVNREPNTDTVNVTVEVANVISERKLNGQDLVQSGVYDLRLFRDGQIVGYMQPAIGKRVPDRKQSNNAEIEQWRETNRVKLDENRKSTITFSGIKLPDRTDSRQVEFSAYAFNSDRVKSRTDRKTFTLPTGVTPRKGRAYIITVGVNAYENRDFNLEFAADDARRIQQTVSEKLSATGQYEKVIPISLLSDYKTVDGQSIVTLQQSTKDNFKTVLQLLSKRSGEVDRKTLTGIPNIEELRLATPDDLVLIAYSSHGYADREGNFYLIPFDTGIGEGKIFTETVREHSISSDELSLWLRDVDAGEMVMIVDACHSTAAVAGQEFKPGPMGSRGLGQLSYDKGMRILTATQADNVAWEYPDLKQGVLTYALVRDGIEARQADFKPRNGLITLAEWLSYGAARVPTLYEEVRAGKVQNFGLTTLQQPKLMVVTSKGKGAATRKGLEEVLIQSNTTQQPSLFDFARRRTDVVIVSGR